MEKEGHFLQPFLFGTLLGHNSQKHIQELCKEKTQIRESPVGTSNAAGEGKHSNPADLLGLIRPAAGLGHPQY